MPFILWLPRIQVILRQFSIHTSPNAGDVWLSLNGTTYQNNSLVTLEDIGEDDDALYCMSNLTACSKPTNNTSGLGNWFFPMELEFPALINNGISTEPEVRWWCFCIVEGVEGMGSTAVNYLIH